MNKTKQMDVSLVQHGTAHSSSLSLLVLSVGGIVAGKGGTPSPAGGTPMASANVCNDLDSARRDPLVKAVVFRVDSPGKVCTQPDHVAAYACLTLPLLHAAQACGLSAATLQPSTVC